MPRINKVTEKVFAEIAETPKKKGSYTTFLNIDKVMGLPESDSLKEFKGLYDELTSENKGTISTLSTLEEIIIQTRCKEVIESELRLSLSRNYIYARSVFYRRGNKINDIRVVIGRTEDYGTDLENLLSGKTFRNLCKDTLIAAMTKEIGANVETLKTLIRI
jgi:hypothetical protein